MLFLFEKGESEAWEYAVFNLLDPNEIEVYWHKPLGIFFCIRKIKNKKIFI